MAEFTRVEPNIRIDFWVRQTLSLYTLYTFALYTLISLHTLIITIIINTLLLLQDHDDLEALYDTTLSAAWGITDSNSNSDDEDSDLRDYDIALIVLTCVFFVAFIVTVVLLVMAILMFRRKAAASNSYKTLH